MDEFRKEIRQEEFEEDGDEDCSCSYCKKNLDNSSNNERILFTKSALSFLNA